MLCEPSRKAPVRSIMRRSDISGLSALSCIHCIAIHGSPHRNTASCPSGSNVDEACRSVSPVRPRCMSDMCRPASDSDAAVFSSISGWLISIRISSPAAVVPAPRIPILIMAGVFDFVWADGFASRRIPCCKNTKIFACRQQSLAP